MEKKLVTKTVFNKQSRKPILWKHIKDFKFEDEDYITAGYVEHWENGSDNSGGDHYEVEVQREVLETDKEFEKRKQDYERDQKWAKERRYESYLKLKKEFEPEKLEENDDTRTN
jgi:hypothetical protein